MANFRNLTSKLGRCKQIFAELLVNKHAMLLFSLRYGVPSHFFITMQCHYKQVQTKPFTV